MSPPLPFTLQFHITSQSDDPLRQIREAVARSVQDRGLPLSRHAIADLRLCTTEVVANALKHAGGECQVKVMWTGRHLRVDVQDYSIRPPCLGEPNETAESGRGLFLVEAFAQAWGWEPREFGKIVFFLIGPNEIADDTSHEALSRSTVAALPSATSAESSEAPAPSMSDLAQRERHQ
ncbi:MULTISPECIES: ATP-binding protein [Kitasatospora]|uniref:ATP-binding protein n=1 Tax=Kitasatospora TaxID=2063 RepID=UPI000CAFAA15|nr:ATP-binding protein [Kitasatospora sp. GP30]MDH6142901.1 anti-sigma regulatory factor (Ser/Thr protein kinase) [Kitasatospora sp. GP30]